MSDYKRPNIPYTGEALPNNTRYELLTQNRQPPTPVLMDSEMNYVIDSLNDLDHKIKDVEAGAIPGSSETINKDKLLKTDGQGNLSWILAGEAQLALASVGTDQVKDGAITTPKIGNASITTDKIYDQNVTTPKVRDGAITSSKLADSAVIHPKIAQGAIDFSKIALMPSRQRSIVVTANATGQWTTMGTAPNDKSGYYPRSRSNADMHWSRIQASDLDAGVVGEVQLAANAITTPKIQNSAITNAKLASDIAPGKLKGNGNTIVTTTGPGYQGAGIGLTSAPNKIMCSKGVAPFGEFRSLGPADLPKIGMQPIYMINFKADGKHDQYNPYNPFNFVSKFEWVSPSYYQITLTDYAAKFVAQGTAFINSPYVVNFKIIEKTGVYLRFIFSQQVGDSVSYMQSAGSIILYKIA